MTTQEKIERFAILLEKQQIERMQKLGYHNILQGKHPYHSNIVPGRKYTKIDFGNSGKYMVVNNTEQIFGIKAYGVIHRGHYYGTLDEVDSWFWGDYTAVKIT